MQKVNRISFVLLVKKECRRGRDCRGEEEEEKERRKRRGNKKSGCKVEKTKCRKKWRQETLLRNYNSSSRKKDDIGLNEGSASGEKGMDYLRDIEEREGFPCGSAGKESACNAGDLGSISGLGRSPGEGKGYPLQYSGLENSMDCIVHGVAKSRT